MTNWRRRAKHPEVSGKSRTLETVRTRSFPKLVIFDLDGTLVDTVPDIAFALNRALSDLDLPAVFEHQVRCWVGNGARVLCGRALRQDSEGNEESPLVDTLLARFLARYAEHVCVSSRIYPGVIPVLDKLVERDCRLACVTNKPMQHTEQLLAALSLRERFALVLGGDSMPRRKPDPLPLLECLRHFGVDPADAVMVGDSGNDIAAARAANIDSFCVTYGYNQGRDVHELGSSHVLETLADLDTLFE